MFDINWSLKIFWECVTFGSIVKQDNIKYAENNLIYIHSIR